MTDLMGARVASHTTLTPTAFRATHPDVTSWSATDWETFQNLAEIARDASGLSTVGLAALDRVMAATVDAAYRELNEQDLSWAKRLPKQVEYELAAGGIR